MEPTSAGTPAAPDAVTDDDEMNETDSPDVEAAEGETPEPETAAAAEAPVEEPAADMTVDEAAEVLEGSTDPEVLDRLADLNARLDTIEETAAAIVEANAPADLELEDAPGEKDAPGEPEETPVAPDGIDPES